MVILSTLVALVVCYKVEGRDRKTINFCIPPALTSFGLKTRKYERRDELR